MKDVERRNNLEDIFVYIKVIQFYIENLNSEDILSVKYTVLQRKNTRRTLNSEDILSVKYTVLQRKHTKFVTVNKTLGIIIQFLKTFISLTHIASTVRARYALLLLHCKDEILGLIMLTSYGGCNFIIHVKKKSVYKNKLFQKNLKIL